MPRRAHRLTWLDVFTATPLLGNGLAVVHDADDVDEATMLAFARETRLSETTFVQTPGRPGATYRNRIWDTEHEMPFAGHPSLGTAVAVARARGDREAEYVQETPAGLQPVRVALGEDGDLARASVLTEPWAFGAEVEPEVALGAVGLAPGAAGPAPPQLVATGAWILVCLVGEPAALDAVRPAAAALRALQDAHTTSTLYLAWWDGAERAVARSFFAQDDGWAEDPATGSAAGPLLALLHRRFGAERLDVEQGVHMGRPSLLRCVVEGERVRVGGDVVVVADGTVLL